MKESKTFLTTVFLTLTISSFIYAKNLTLMEQKYEYRSSNFRELPREEQKLHLAIIEYQLGRKASAFDALSWLAEEGYAEAQFYLAEIYKTGVYDRRSFIQSDEKAAELYEKSAKQGIVEAQNSVGELYISGKGVKQNYQTAVKWFQKAADLGYSWAQLNLADAYYNGQGVKQNFRQAFKWYEKAAEQENDIKSPTMLGEMYYTGKGIPQNIEKAKFWLGKACNEYLHKPACELYHQLK